MLIILTNDDGVNAEGINRVEKELRRFADVLMVAPDREQSASSHSLTLDRPLRLNRVGDNRYTCDGTPTDCVMLAVHGLLKHRLPDLLVSGINHGANMGEDVTYSGTVAAAIEGSTMGIPSIAASNADPENNKSFGPAARFIARLARRFGKLELPLRTFLSVNFPRLNGTRFGRYKFTRLGRRVYKDIVIEKTDPRGKNYYWIAGESEWKDVEQSDFEAVSNGYISISPLKMNFTDYDTIEQVKRLKMKI